MTAERVCPSCATPNPATTKFCGECGYQFAATAKAPSREQAPTSSASADKLRQFIQPELLHKLEQARTGAAMKGERRTVTMLFCDVTGSTAAAETLDPEDWAEIINGAFDLMINPVFRYEGTIARLMGDAILAFFGAPIAHEDDPQRAILAGLDIIETTRPYRDEMRQRWGIDFDVRVGINTGLVVVGEVGSDLRVEYTALGDAVNLAARMEQTADPGTVRIAPDTYRLVAPLFDVDDIGPIEVKGKSEPIPVYRVRRAKTEPGRLRGIEGLHSPLVGRERDLATLRSAVDDLRAGRGQLCSVMGDAGLGKSRLVTELKEQLQAEGIVAPDDDAGSTDAAAPEVQWVEGRSYSYETQTPYAPFVRLLSSCTGVSADDDAVAATTRVRQHLRSVMGERDADVTPFVLTVLGLPLTESERELVDFVDPPLLRERIFGAVSSYLSTAAEGAPLVAVLEDLHWADPTSLDLVDRLLPLSASHPFLLLAVFRPRREDGSWQVHERAAREFADRHVSIELRPLDTEQSRQLVANLLEIEGLPEHIRQLILDKSEGNPFFVEEVIRSLLDAGVVVPDGPYWKATRDIEDIAVPDTLVSVLTTRLDMLDDEAKLVACTAAVIGRSFDVETLAAITDGTPDLDKALATLEQRGLVRHTGRVTNGGATHDRTMRTFAFKHVLTQQTAYEASLLSARRAMHLRLAERIEHTEPDRVYDLARHFVEARAASRAIPYLVAAGQHSARSFSLAEAIGYFRKAIELFGDDDDMELGKQAYEGLIEALGFTADPTVMDVVAEAVAMAEARDHVPTKVMALNKQAFFIVMGTGDVDMAAALLLDVEQQAKAAGDLAGLAEMHTTYCMVNMCSGRLQKANEHLAEAIEVGTELGSDAAQAFGRTHHSKTLLLLMKFDEAGPAVEKAMAFAERTGQLPFLAELKGELYPTLLLQRGDVAAARASALEGLELAHRIGSLLHQTMNSASCAQYAMAMGDWEQALELGTAAFALGGQMGAPFFQMPAAASLASIHAALNPADVETVCRFEDTCEEMMRGPLGLSAEAPAMGELGFVALGRGDLVAAAQRFDQALGSCSSPGGLVRPMLLSGRALTALAAGDVELAQATVDEAVVYLEANHLENFRPLVELAGANVDLARGCTEEALARAEHGLELAERMGLRPLATQLASTAAAALHALGRDDEAAEMSDRARATIEDLADLITDPDRRETYRGHQLHALAG